VGSEGRSREVPAIEGMEDLDAAIEYQDASGRAVRLAGVTQRDLLVSGGEPDALVRCGLDFQGRPCYVAVMAPAAPASVAAAARGQPVRRQTELAGEELEAFWRSAARVASLHGGFRDMRLNAGSFQNVAHLHLKVFIDEASFLEVWGGTHAFRQLRAGHRRQPDEKGSGKKTRSEDTAGESAEPTRAGL